MKTSISRKIFLTTIIAFMVVFAVQWAVISNSFSMLYRNSILSSARSELRDTINRYRPSKVFEISSEISDYVNATGNPLMVIDDSGRICDRDILRRMRTITLNYGDSSSIIVPCGYLFTTYGTNAPYLSTGRRVSAELLQLGSSDVYDPINIHYDGLDFRSRKNKALYIPEVEERIIDVTSIIKTTNNLTVSDDSLCRRAEALYDAVKVPMGLGTDIASSIGSLNGTSVTIQGFDYRFICESEVIGGTRYHFVALSRVVITGFEQAYINRFLYTTYAVIAAVVVTVALLLSRYISRPLENLSTATQKIAALDFSETPVQYKGDDEIGRLTENINTMSDNLEGALAQLEDATEKAHENEERMKRLLEDTAHEFKTPLGIVSGYFDIIRLGIDEQKKEEFYGIIESEIEGLADLVDETIALTKLQSGYWSVTKEECSLSDILQFASARFEQRFAEKGYTLERGDDDTLVLCDKSKILLVVSNFLSNAFKYSDDRRLIRISSEDMTGGRVKVTVANSGKMDREVEEKLWNRNYSTQSASPARLASQGVGLNIVKQILEAHGSDYGVYQTGEMVCFWFTLERSAGRGGSAAGGTEETEETKEA
jgi:signal transduction histidine kinase